MQLFRRSPANETVPTELEPYLSRGPGGRVWLGRILIGLLILILVAAIVWTGIKVVQNITGNDEESKAPNTAQNEQRRQKEQQQKQQQQNQAQGNNNAANNPSGGTGAGSSNQNGAGSSSSGSTSQTQTNQNKATQPTIPKTGDDPTDRPPGALPATGG